MSLFRKFFLRDGEGNDRDAYVNASNELLTKDTDVATGLSAIETNQTDKTQMTQITDATNEVDVLQNADDDSTPEDKYGLVTSSVLYGRTSGTDIRPIRIDSATNSIQSLSYEHHEIHSGSHYFVKGVAQIPALNDVLDFTWLMPDTAVWTHWNWQIEVSKGVTWYIYEDATATNPLANTITPINSNRNSANTSGTTMKYEIQADLATANADTDVSGATLIASGIIGDNRTGGNANRSNEIVLKQGKLYCLRSVATAASDLNFDMQWYEHTDKS